jgi:hypothetical protein
LEREDSAVASRRRAAYWALGDALIEECGVDPVWDADILECTIKGGTKLRDAAEWLEDHGCNYSPWELYEFREMSERFAPADAPPSLADLHGLANRYR